MNAMRRPRAVLSAAVVLATALALAGTAGAAEADPGDGPLLSDAVLHTTSAVVGPDYDERLTLRASFSFDFAAHRARYGDSAPDFTIAFTVDDGRDGLYEEEQCGTRPITCDPSTGTVSVDLRVRDDDNILTLVDDPGSYEFSAGFDDGFVNGHQESITAPERLQVRLATRIRSFDVGFEPVRKGAKVKASGRLLTAAIADHGHGSMGYVALRRSTVELWFRPAGGASARVKRTTTDAKGVFRFAARQRTKGTWEARYPGSSLRAPITARDAVAVR